MPEFKELQILLDKYFPERFSVKQMDQFRIAFESYLELNSQINVISRKDIGNLAERHFLHALGVCLALEFEPGTQVLDVGTGGGFPGIPLAIAFPEVKFHLVDSIAKKIKVVDNIVQVTGLQNVSFSVQRMEKIKDQYDFVTGRAVTKVDRMVSWLRKKVHCENRNSLGNGLLYLKGGEEKELVQEAREIAKDSAVIPLASRFEEAFFSSKFLVHVPFCK